MSLDNNLNQPLFDANELDISDPTLLKDVIRNNQPSSLIDDLFLESLFEPDNIREGESLKKIINSRSLKGILEDLNTSETTGISEEKLEAQFLKYGKNELITQVSRSLISITENSLKKN